MDLHNAPVSQPIPGPIEPPKVQPPVFRNLISKVPLSEQYELRSVSKEMKASFDKNLRAEKTQVTEFLQVAIDKLLNIRDANSVVIYQQQIEELQELLNQINTRNIADMGRYVNVLDSAENKVIQIFSNLKQEHIAWLSKPNLKLPDLFGDIFKKITTIIKAKKLLHPREVNKAFNQSFLGFRALPIIIQCEQFDLAEEIAQKAWKASDLVSFAEKYTLNGRWKKVDDLITFLKKQPNSENKITDLLQGISIGAKNLENNEQILDYVKQKRIELQRDYERK